ncbi:putative nuclease HARBI1 [Sitophilus oryzae]|uniref:Nuclease HARBI1 n=1 Tax=Sitophilus oryzae TaxID=7048 RepID=A0A6J2XDU8_SITOR|nr:putative nuclease HARBI1 [Sitophilus oryzae]
MYNDDLFKEHFSMSRASFQTLVNVLGRIINHENDKIDFHKKVLFSIWTISKPESFLAIGDRFNFGKSTAHGVFKQIICALASLIREYVRFPQPDEYYASTVVFNQRSRGFPGVLGAIDGCHIPIKQTEGNEHDFYNRKGFHSIILQGTCDHMGKFIDCYIGMPGRMHDARVFRNSSIYMQLTGGNLLLPRNLHIIGDSVYPLLTNLTTPYRDTGHLTPHEINYNIKLSSIRSIIERVFGILKNKFRRLKFLDISDPDFGNEIIAAAVVLYNFLITMEDINLYEDIIDVDLENPEAGHKVGNLVDNAAVEKRNEISANLLN